ncbi:MAG: O-antigen/teichoic acid export membrane protein [Parvicella sp.]|jgi:O-antigen/teichoic acid export membrane protein
MRSIIKKIKSNLEKFLILGDQAIVSGANFATGIILARTLGLDQYGLFAFIWLSVLFFSSLHQALIIMPLYTLFPKSDNKQSYLANLMAIQIIFSIFTFIGIFLIISISSSIYFDWNISQFKWTLSAVAAGFVFNDYLRRLFFTLHMPKTSLGMDVIGYGLQPILLLFLAYQNALSINSALVSIFILQMTSSLLGLLLSYRSKISIKEIKGTFTDNLNFSKYLIGTSLLQWLSGNLFLAVGASLLGTAALGAIRIAQNIVGVLNVLFLAMENIVPVRAAEVMKSEGTKSMINYIGKISKQSVIPVLLILGMLIGFRSQIITLFYGSQFQSIDSILIGFGGLYVLVFLGTLLRFAIRTLENNKVIFLSYVLTTLFSLVMAQPLVVNYHLNGILIGLFSVQIINIIIYLFSLKTELKWLYKSYI